MAAVVPPLPIRYLALDLGSKRIGIAVSDGLGLTALPLLTLHLDRKPSPTPRDVLRSVARLARKHAVHGIVVGLPLHLSGEESPRAAKARSFAAELAEFTGLPVYPWDERLTSEEAHQRLYQSGRKRQEHKELVDQVAAVLILESFLAGQEHFQSARAQLP